MLCSGKFSATAGSLDLGPGHAVQQPQMGMNRCHFNYVPSLLFEAGRNVGFPYYPRNSTGTQQRRLAGQLEIYFYNICHFMCLTVQETNSVLPLVPPLFSFYV